MDQEQINLLDEFLEFYQRIQTNKKKVKKLSKKLEKLKQVELDDEIVQFLFKEKYFDDSLRNSYEDEIKEFQIKFFNTMQENEQGQAQTLNELFPDENLEEDFDEDEQQEIINKSVSFLNGDDSAMDDLSLYFTKKQFENVKTNLHNKKKYHQQDQQTIKEAEEEEYLSEEEDFQKKNETSIDNKSKQKKSETSIDNEFKQNKNNNIRNSQIPLNISKNTILQDLNIQSINKNNEENCKQKNIINVDDIDNESCLLIDNQQENYQLQKFQNDNLNFEYIYKLNNENQNFYSSNISYLRENFYKVFNKQVQQLEVKGFYGQKNIILEKVKQYFQKDVTINNYKDDILGIMGLQIDKKYAVIFIIPQNYIDQKIDYNNGIKELLKILNDISSQIIICTQQDFQIHDCQNQFIQQPKNGYLFQRNQNHDKFDVQEAQCELDQEYYQFLQGKKQLYKIDYQTQIKKSSIEVTISKQELQQLIGQDNQIDQEKDKLNFDDVFDFFDLNLEQIIENKNPKDILELLRNVFKNFIIDDEKDNFVEQIDQYIQSKQQFMKDLDDDDYESMSDKDKKNFKSQRKKLYSDKFPRRIFKKLIVDYITENEFQKEEEEQDIYNINIYLTFCKPQYKINNNKTLNHQIDILDNEQYNGTLQYEFDEDSDFYFKNFQFINRNQGYFIMIDSKTQNEILIGFEINQDKFDLKIITYLKKDSQICTLSNDNLIFLFLNQNQKAYQIEFDDNLEIDNKNRKTIKIYSQKIKEIYNVIYNVNKHQFIYQNQDGNIYTYDIEQQQSQKLNYTNQQYKMYMYNIDKNIFVGYTQNDRFEIYNNGQLIETNFMVQNLDNFTIEIKNNMIVLQYIDQNILIVAANNINEDVLQIDFQEIQNYQSQQQWNSLLDYFYLSQQQYGKKLSLEDNDQLRLIADKNKIQKMRNYFNKIQLLNYTLSWRQDDDIEEIQVDKFQLIIETRVPISIAIVQNKKLIPLYKEQNNKRELLNDQNFNDQVYKLIESQINKINFGAYESVNKLKFDKLKVISILGIQSEEKDLLLNELFTSRINHNLNKNFNGIQMCLYSQKENNKQILYVVLNLKGFSNKELLQQEQIRLSLVCAAISDLTIYYDTNELDNRFKDFNIQLSLLKNKLKGKKLFQGQLLLLLQNELQNKSIDNILQDIDKSMSKFFVDNRIFNKIKMKELVNSKQSNYQQCVNQIKEEYIKSIVGRQQQYKEFINDLKLVLVQTFLDDNYDMEQIQYLISLKNQTKKLIYISNNFIYQDYMQDVNIDLKKLDIEKQEVNLEEICTLYNTNQIIESFVKQSDIKDKLNKQQNDNEILNDIQHPFNNGKLEKMKNLYLNFENYEIANHKFFFKQFERFMQIICQIMQKVALEQYNKIIIKEQNYEKINEVFKIQLLESITNQYKYYKICQKSCSQCQRVCAKQLNHNEGNDKSCNCFTDHKCINLCNRDKCRSKGNVCGQFDTKNHAHLCVKEQHFCQKICQEHDDCDQLCKKEKDHKERGHDCQKKQFCGQKCSAIGCNNLCKKTKDENHEDSHQCHIQKCHHKCMFCDKQCIFDKHFHENRIQDKQESRLFYKNKKLNYHICGDKHICQEYCEHEGECEIVYDLIGDNQTNIIQKRMKLRCGIILNELEKEHPEGIKHQCVKKDQQHTCSEMCPQCGTYCQKQFGHNGQHTSSNHRLFDINKSISNSQNNTSRSRTQRTRQNLDVQYTFCSQNCQNFENRYHHKIQCTQKPCLQKKFQNKSKHFMQQAGQNYDEVECELFWQISNWDKPIL